STPLSLWTDSRSRGREASRDELRDGGDERQVCESQARGPTNYSVRMATLRTLGILILACGLTQAARSAERPSSGVATTMRAAAIDGPGDSSVLTLHTLPVPKPGAKEILIALETAGVAIWDVSIRRHPAGIQHSSFPLVLGTDGAGTVAALGSEVHGFKVGDRVYSYSWDNPKGGFYAEYVA